MGGGIHRQLISDSFSIIVQCSFCEITKLIACAEDLHGMMFHY